MAIVEVIYTKEHNLTGIYKKADWKLHNGIMTPDLDTCVALVTYSPEEASIAHMTIMTYFSDYIGWLRENIKPANAFIVGGIDDSADSKILVQRLEIIAEESGHKIIGKDLFGVKSRDIFLSKQGILTIAYFRQWMNGEQEIEKIPTGLAEFQLNSLSVINPKSANFIK